MVLEIYKEKVLSHLFPRFSISTYTQKNIKAPNSLKKIRLSSNLSLNHKF